MNDEDLWELEDARTGIRFFVKREFYLTREQVAEYMKEMGLPPLPCDNN